MRIWNYNFSGIHNTQFEYPDSMVHGANMGPNWGRQDPGGPHVGHMNFAIWVSDYMVLAWIPRTDFIGLTQLQRGYSSHHPYICYTRTPLNSESNGLSHEFGFYVQWNGMNKDINSIKDYWWNPFWLKFKSLAECNVDHDHYEQELHPSIIL